MNKCIKEVKRPLEKSEPYQEFARLKAGLTQHDKNQIANHATLLTALADRGAATTAYYENNSPENFERAVAAIEAHRRIDAAWNFLSSFSGSKTAPLQTPEAEAIVLKCTRLLRDALAKKVKALNDEEQARLQAEGLDSEGREHPAISDLKAYLSRLAESIVQLESRKEAGTSGGFQWSHHTQLFDI
jgi:hypothetical protein